MIKMVLNYLSTGLIGKDCNLKVDTMEYKNPNQISRDMHKHGQIRWKQSPLDAVLDRTNSQQSSLTI